MLKVIDVDVVWRSCGRDNVVVTSAAPEYIGFVIDSPYALASDIVCVLPKVVQLIEESVPDAVTTCPMTGLKSVIVIFGVTTPSPTINVFAMDAPPVTDNAADASDVAWVARGIVTRVGVNVAAATAGPNCGVTLIGMDADVAATVSIPDQVKFPSPSFFRYPSPFAGKPARPAPSTSRLRSDSCACAPGTSPLLLFQFEPGPYRFAKADIVYLDIEFINYR